MNTKIVSACAVLGFALASLHLGTLPARAAASEGILPKDKTGRALNLDFEEGTLRDWTATGRAFEKQPVRGDTVAPRRADMKSGHQGNYWIGTYEIAGDDPQGTLTSVPFTVTHPWASFLLAGGPHANTRVELLRSGQSEPFFKISGYEHESLRPVIVDLRPHLKQEIVIRIVDHQSGHWGHINFDNFRFHPEKPIFPNVLDPAKAVAESIAPADVVKFAGLSPEEAARAVTVPPGFSVKLFAGEPDVQQPIAFALDHRGRIWVAEGHNYPRRAPEGQGKDRIFIFEDLDGDGKFDKRTLFMDKLNLVSGLEIGFGGVWVGAAPHLMFIPDRDGDDKPDGEPEILLDGWDYIADTHETLNTFAWGPDGWLYGCHGVFCPSFVGKPGTPREDRQRVDAAVWRYHPTKHIFEVFAEGTSNPWGIDFDDYGQCIIEACVIPHLWHMIQGGRYHRQGGQHYNISLEEQRANEPYTQARQRHINPFIYDDIKTIADHVHYTGNRGPHAANNRSDAAGGGHAHAGLMIYLGDSWPDQYRNQAFMGNIHGQRLNVDRLERKGSGYVGKHEPDFLNFNDTWSQTLNQLYDQDGSVYIIDWYDKNQCHHNQEDGHDRSNGRIFKVVYNETKTTHVNLQQKSDAELVQLQLHKNDWHVRHARRILQHRAHTHGPSPAVHRGLEKILLENGDITRQLRALWALHVTGGLPEELALQQLNHSSEYLRAWSIQLLAEDKKPSAAARREFLRLAQNDPSPFVRLYLAAALQRMPVPERRSILHALVAREEDAADHNLPLMYWFAAEPVVAQDLGQAVELLKTCKIPVVREFISRRMVATGAIASN